MELVQAGLVGVLGDVESRKDVTFFVRSPDEAVLVIHGRNPSRFLQQKVTGPNRTPTEGVVESGKLGPSAAEGTDASSSVSSQAAALAVSPATLNA